MKDNVRFLPPKKPRLEKTKTKVKKFLNKSTGETTFGDMLIMHASTVVISIVLGMTIQGVAEKTRGMMRRR